MLDRMNFKVGSTLTFECVCPHNCPLRDDISQTQFAILDFDKHGLVVSQPYADHTPSHLPGKVRLTVNEDGISIGPTCKFKVASCTENSAKHLVKKYLAYRKCIAKGREAGQFLDWETIDKIVTPEMRAVAGNMVEDLDTNGRILLPAFTTSFLMMLGEEDINPEKIAFASRMLEALLEFINPVCEDETEKRSSEAIATPGTLPN